MAWIAIFLCCGVLFSVRRWNTSRASSIPQLELTANCLLTRFPILFVGGKTSLFYNHHYWNTHPDFLSQHGYEVYNFEIQTRNSRKRREELRQTFQTLEKQKQKYHVFIDSTSFTEIQNLLTQNVFDSIASITCLCSSTEEFQHSHPAELRGPKIPIEELTFSNTGKSPLFWKMHRLFVSDADPNVGPIGLATQHDLQQIRTKILHRAVELAERDFAQTGKPHDEFKKRNQERSI